MKNELWKVFYLSGKEIYSYTISGTFKGEEQATKELLAYENHVDVSEIKIKIKTKKR